MTGLLLMLVTTFAAGALGWISHQGGFSRREPVRVRADRPLDEVHDSEDVA
jgi:hypothetical protein